MTFPSEAEQDAMLAKTLANVQKDQTAIERANAEQLAGEIESGPRALLARAQEIKETL
jgi:hypothetical protein